MENNAKKLTFIHYKDTSSTVIITNCKEKTEAFVVNIEVGATIETLNTLLNSITDITLINKICSTIDKILNYHVNSYFE